VTSHFPQSGVAIDPIECGAKLFLSKLIIHLIKLETWFVDLKSFNGCAYFVQFVDFLGGNGHT
jgi:hypothetical protein